jgi:hypothetical protein
MVSVLGPTEVRVPSVCVIPPPAVATFDKIVALPKSVTG